MNEKEAEKCFRKLGIQMPKLRKYKIREGFEIGLFSSMEKH